MEKSIYSVKIGGHAGMGIKSAGLMLAKVATRSGYFTYDYTEYPSLIRGGHNAMEISIASYPVHFVYKKVDLLVALNQETVRLHAHEGLRGVIFDSSDKIDLSVLDSSVVQYNVPLSQLAGESGNKELLRNTVALGAVVGLLGGDIAILKTLISEEFHDKSPHIVEMNHLAAAKGFEYILKSYAQFLQQVLLPRVDKESLMIVNGNESVALGALSAGLQFAAIYPMSPISGMLQILADYQESCGFVYKQPEDEIAAIIMAIGASYAGARAMTASSGGGFCLMTEGLGLAGITETPLVIVEGMRGGPATGLPTWSEQGDLRFVLHAHQGDFPRIVIAPGDAAEAFSLTREAFQLADRYQTPVVILIDKNICENDQSVELFTNHDFVVDRGRYTRDRVENYERYAHAEDGVSLRTSPGAGNFFVTNSDEHDPVGYSTEDADERIAQMNKRMRKLDVCAQNMPAPELFGPEKAAITFISWGSNKGAILEGMSGFDNVNYLHLTWMNPFPGDVVRTVLERAHYVVCVECNYTKQFTGLVKEKTGIEIADVMNRYDGRPFYPEDIVAKINDVLHL